MKRRAIQHEFVEYVPRDLEEGVLYVSIPFATAVHRCPCGCGNKVVTPITPTGWHLLFDGEAVSLTPSIGNWALPCRSHYWIRSNGIQWAGAWTDKMVAAGQLRDNRDLELNFASRAGSAASTKLEAGKAQRFTRSSGAPRLRRWFHR